MARCADRRGWPRFAIVAIALIIATVVLSGGAGATSARKHQAALTPIVVFPAYHFTRLIVTAHNQRVDAACPRSGSFEDFFPDTAPSSTFSQVCRDELMTLSYRPHGAWQTRFSDPQGVDVEIAEVAESLRPLYLDYLRQHGA